MPHPPHKGSHALSPLHPLDGIARGLRDAHANILSVSQALRPRDYFCILEWCQDAPANLTPTVQSRGGVAELLEGDIAFLGRLLEGLQKEKASR